MIRKIVILIKIIVKITVIVIQIAKVKESKLMNDCTMSYLKKLEKSIKTLIIMIAKKQ